MAEQATIILAVRETDAFASLEDTLPGVRVVAIGAEPLREPVVGRLWCFVDWLMPSISGLEICRRLRDSPKTARSHITMVLDEDDSEIQRRALRVGADNYVQGPLTQQLVAAQLKEYNALHPVNFAAKRLKHGPLMVDLAAHQMRYNNRAIPLRPNELKLMTHFIEHPDRLFTRSQLITMLNKDCEAIDERTVDVWVGRLRRSLKANGVPDQLRTVRSMGYVLDSVWQSDGASAA